MAAKPDDTKTPLHGAFLCLVATGGPIRDKSALPIWTPEAPRRGDEQSEESTESGQSGYTETFVEHWLHKVQFYQAEPWAFTTIYTSFRMLAIIVWLLVRSGGKNV